MKKNKIVVLLLLATVTMLYTQEAAGVLHTITTESSDINKSSQSINIRIRNEGIKRIVRVPASTTETVEIGYKDSKGKYYKKDGTEWKVLEQYYNYVKNQNSYVVSENEIIEIENVGYYEREIIIKSRILTTADYKEVEIPSQAEISIIVISENETPKKIISFKDKYALREISEQTLKDWQEWLKKEDKAEIKEHIQKSQIVYKALKSDTPYKGLYEEGGECLRAYFEIPFANKEYKNGERIAKGAEGYVTAEVSYKAGGTIGPFWYEIIEIIKGKEFINDGIDNKGLLKKVTGIETNEKAEILNKGEIVPSLEEVKLGDIVVFKEKNKSESGIVIETETGIKVAYVEPEGKTEKIKLEEIKAKADYQEIVIIRLLKDESEKEDVSKATWNVLDKTPKGISIKIESMKEASQKSDEKHRWIPNTGEYLKLGKIKVVVKTKQGIQLEKEDLKIKLVGAVDREYTETSSTKEGNIYNNKANKFEIKINDDPYILKRVENNQEYELYKTENNQEVKKEIELEINTQDYIEYKSFPLKIEIRPDTKQIYPGDDLLLLFKIGETEYTVAPEDYIAVYDKKMLWRANLYINEIEQNLGNLDWNEAHKWNIPSQKEETEAEEVSSWWSSSWGYNEWNKQYDLGRDSEIESLKDLQSGNGGQVVNFTEWTPLRKENGNITDRVAYDYPFKKEGNKSEIYAWDSPFDFVYKLNQQKNAIKSNFLAELEKVKTEEEKAKKGKETAVFYNEDKTEIAGNKKTIGELSEWETTTAPNNRWRYYWREGEKGFIPSGGLYIKTIDSTINDIYYDEKQNTAKIEMINRKSAGTDCVGFAERTASYSGNEYKWNDLPNGWIEGETPDKTERLTYYPQNAEASNIILSKEKIGTLNSHFTEDYVSDNVITSNNLSESEFKEFKSQFLKVIPGDIITYKEGTEYAHIGIITNVDYEGIKQAQSIVSIMDNIQVIESIYGSYVNYVFKRQLMDGMGTDYKINGKTFYKGSWFLDWDTEAKIRNFQIERLITEENTNK